MSKFVSVSESGSFCPRTIELEIKYKSGLLDYKPNEVAHYYSARGILSHFTIEQIFKKVDIDWSYKFFANNEDIRNRIPEWLFNECLPFIKDTYFKVMLFVQNYMYLFDGAVVENRMYANITDNYVLTGKPDLRNSNMILDWKSNKYSNVNAKKYFKQLYGYDYLLDITESEKHRDYVLVFLGSDNPKVVIANEEQRKDAEEGFISDLSELILCYKKAYNNEHLPAKFSFSCTMCKWNGYCRGI